MPKNADALFRQWHMLRAIPRYPQKVTTRQLRECLARDGFNITERSIQRDLNDLASCFPLLCDDREKPFGWSWNSEASLSLSALTISEALGFSLAERFLLPFMPSSLVDQLTPHFTAARKCLAQAPKPPSGRSWLEKVRNIPPTQALLAPPISPAVYAAVTCALLEERKLRFSYQQRDAESSKEYLVNPLGLVQRGAISYLVAQFEPNEKIYQFALHRIQSAAIQLEQANLPSDFSLDVLIQSGYFGFGTGELITLEVIFQNGYGEHLFESPLSAVQTLERQSDGTLRLIADVPDTHELCWWLLGFGSGAEVRRPLQYRTWFRDTSEEMALLYRERTFV